MMTNEACKVAQEWPSPWRTNGGKRSGFQGGSEGRKERGTMRVPMTMTASRKRTAIYQRLQAGCQSFMIDQLHKSRQVLQSHTLADLKSACGSQLRLPQRLK